jgi:hypothetical protein
MRYLLLILFVTPVWSQSLQIPQQPPAYGNFVYIDQIGNTNQIYINQMGSDRDQTAVLLKGDSNDVTVNQTGSGRHTAMVTPTPMAMSSTNSLNTFAITQNGSGNHSATIQQADPVSNSGNTASIFQSGGIGAEKQFTLQLQGSNIGVTVIQDNPTIRDSASMSIQCLTPPCTGYSYTRH